ncbi:S49 family peptidase [Methylobacterium sp. J-030]|uniref:S49 family peptidase n=1 Tax=Methylobacterium sp. J-030 TaxID=2836627 RepID=UPI001FBAAE00|nr:S49 family peptidase [Methylobacterium sp. J-030]MCJ2067762.1 S49 family peptidase [Methylobacterium sp. J-030]
MSMSVEGLLYRPLALLPAHATALLERLRIIGADRPVAPSAFLDGVEETASRDRRRPYEVVDGIAIVRIQGVLVHGDDCCWWWGETSYASIRRTLLAALADPEVKAVVLHVDSPGGEVAGCFDLADDIYRLRGEKPIVAIVDEYCCSAAYALASAADRIVAPRTAVIGSIGVITMHLDVTAALEQAGLKVTTVQFGDRKSDSYPTTVLSDDARKRMQADIDSLGKMFVALVARNRDLNPDAVRATEAGTFLGAAAVKAGLSDAVLTPDAAFAALVETLGD